MGTYQFDLEVQGNYGHGYETVTGAENWTDAKRLIREYRENEPGVPFRLKRVRTHVK